MHSVVMISCECFGRSVFGIGCQELNGEGGKHSGQLGVGWAKARAHKKWGALPGYWFCVRQPRLVDAKADVLMEVPSARNSKIWQFRERSAEAQWLVGSQKQDVEIFRQCFYSISRLPLISILSVLGL